MDLPEVASIAVIHNGKTLWLQRADNHRFTMPGGHLEPNEEPIAGAARELNEEAGIDPNGGLIYLGQDVSRGRIIHAFALHCDELPEVNIANDPDKEAVGHYWLDELPDNPHVPHEHNVALKLLNPLTKSETKKFWKSKDGAVKIPHHTNPDRKDWDKRYYDSLVQHFGYGDPSRLQPVEIPVTPNISGTNAVKDKTRHSLYVRMLRGGDTVPPLVVRRNGISWHVLDGNHRLDAALQAGAKTLKAYEMVDPKPKGKLKKSESPSTLDHGIAHHDQDVWIEEAPYGELLKGKKDALNMYPQEIRNHPDTKVHLDWAYGKMPNENWSLWTVRHHRTTPQDFTPEVKQKIEHFAGSQHIPEIANVRFDKTHNLQQGLELLDAAENRYIERTKSKLNLAPKPEGARKHIDLGNGLAWWNLGKPACAHEGKAMGHCGNVPSQREGQHLFSLRQEHKLGDKVYYEPHLTFIRHPDEVGFGEMKGRGNEKPAKHYHKAIVALFKKGHLPIGGGYAPENNFSAEDLSPEDFEEVRQSNPAFAAFRSDAKPEDLHAAFDLSPQSLAEGFTKHKLADAALLRKIVRQLDSDYSAETYWYRPYLNVLEHPNLPEDLMHHLAGHHDPDVREALAANSRTPPEVLHKLAESSQSSIGFNVAEHPNISTETAKLLLNRYADPNKFTHRGVIAALAFNPNVNDPDLVRSLVTHPNPKVRDRIALRENLAPEYVHQLSLDEDTLVRKAVAQRPNTSEEISRRLASDPEYQVREALAYRKDLPHDIAQQLALDPDRQVQQAALGLKEITTETLGKVIDKFPSSRHFVASHPNLTEELMHKLLAMASAPRGLAYRSNLPESIKEALFDRFHSNPLLYHDIAQGLETTHPEFWARKTREKMAEKQQSNQLAKGQIAKEYSYGWGASHQGSKDITHISSKMMGIKGFDEFDDNTQNAHNLARHFLSNMHNHRSPEELGHVTLNHRNLAHNIGDVINLPLTATSTAEDDPSMAYATRGFSVPEEYQSDTTKQNKTKEALYYKFPAGIPYHPYKLNKDDDEPELALEFGQVGEGIVAGRFRVANKIPKVNYVDHPYTEVHLEPVEYFHPEHGWFSAQNKGAMFKKGLKEVALAGALALGGGAAAQENVEPKPNPDLLAAVKRAGIPTTEEGPGKWHTQGLHKELIPIAHLESSFGQNMAHAKGKGGDYDTAYGAVGLKPMTAHEEYLRTPTLQKLYGDLKDPAEFTKKFKADWQFYNLVASAHFARLKKLHGTPEKAAYAWRWGTGAAAGATDEQVANEIYVQKYKNLTLNTGVKKSEALDKMAIKDIPPGQKQTPKSSKYMYDHVLRPEHRAEQYHVVVQDLPIPKSRQPHPNEKHYLRALLYHHRRQVGEVNSTIEGNALSPQWTKVDREHRGKQLGLALYEATYAHALHHHKIERVVGGKHSTAAHYLHQQLSAKHGMKYEAELHPDRGLRDRGDFDSRYEPYEYGIEEGLQKSTGPFRSAGFKHIDGTVVETGAYHNIDPWLMGGTLSHRDDGPHNSSDWKAGFITHAGQFMDREEAAKYVGLQRYNPITGKPRDLDSQDEEAGLKKSAAKLVSKIVPHLTDDLRRAPWKGSDNCLAGHCYVASEALWHLMGGPDSGYVPQSIQHEGGPHWYLKHKVTGEIIDPTAGQFKTPVPYEKGIGKGFLTKLPSKRAQVVIDRVAGKLNKMAIRDLKPQRSAVQEGLGVQTPNPTELEGKTPLEHFPGQVFNYSHYLPEEMRNNLRLSVVTEPQTGRISALVHSPDTRFDEGYGKDIHQEYGRVTGGIYPKSKRLEIGYSFLAKPFRGKGIGLAAYEAIYAHAFHNHKVREVIGLDHSTAAHKVHNSLATKHGLEYKAENQMDWKPSKDFDGKYAPYKYTLKAELQKMAIKDIKGKPIEGEHGLVQLDFSHLLHPEIAKTHKLFTRHYGWEGVPTDHVAVRLVHRDTGDRAGKIDAGVEGRAISPIDVEVFDPKLRGRGVGRAMYEALYGHVYHTLGIKKVVGGTHSSMANKAHLSVTSKHKLPGYNPEQIGRVKGPRDDAFGDYEYSLISRP